MVSQQFRRAEHASEDAVSPYRSSESRESLSERIESSGVGIVSFPLLEAITSPRASRSDTVPTAAGITLGFHILGWFAAQIVNMLVLQIALAYDLRASSLILPMQWVGFVEALVFALALGLVAGRVAPRSATVGIAVGGGIAWGVSLLICLLAIVPRISATLTPANVTYMVLWSLLSAGAVTVTEILPPGRTEAPPSGVKPIVDRGATCRHTSFS